MTPFAAHAPHPAPDAAAGRRTDTGPEETGSEEAVNRSGFNDAYDDAKPAREGAGPERREAAEDRRGAPDAPPPSHQEGRQKAKEEGTRPAEQTPPPKVAGSDSIAEIQFDGSPEAALPDADAALL
nr:hypothetical protein [Paracoccaceae bacterium]